MPKKPPRPKKSLAKNEYQLDNGRRIRLQALNQNRWTEVLARNGVMCFTPTPGTFPALFEIVVEEAKARGATSTPYLIPPIVRLAEYQRPPGRLRLPLWVCTAEFTSSEPVEDSTSTLTVVWFQEEMALPIDPGVLKQIRAINWYELTAPPGIKIQSPNDKYRFLGDREGKAAEKYLLLAQFDGLLPLMTPAQIAKVKKLLPEWKPPK